MPIFFRGAKTLALFENGTGREEQTTTLLLNLSLFRDLNIFSIFLLLNRLTSILLAKEYPVNGYLGFGRDSSIGFKVLSNILFLFSSGILSFFSDLVWL